MKTGKRLLIMAMATLTLVSAPTNAKASETKEQIIFENAGSENAKQMVSENVYKDENGNEVKEKIYVNFEKAVKSQARGSSTIGGHATYRKEQEFYIRTGKTKREKIKCFVEGNFLFKNGKVTVVSSRGAVTRCPKGVTIIGRKALKGSNYVQYKFDAKSKFSKKREYAVKITVAGDGRVR